MESDRRQELVVARRAMACEFSVTFPAGTRDGVEAGCAALDEVDRLEELLSVFREESELSRINREAGKAEREVYELLRWSACLSAATGGAFERRIRSAGRTVARRAGSGSGGGCQGAGADRVAARAISRWVDRVSANGRAVQFGRDRERLCDRLGVAADPEAQCVDAGRTQQHRGRGRNGGSRSLRRPRPRRRSGQLERGCRIRSRAAVIARSRSTWRG